MQDITQEISWSQFATPDDSITAGFPVQSTAAASRRRLVARPFIMADALVSRLCRLPATRLLRLCRRRLPRPWASPSRVYSSLTLKFPPPYDFILFIFIKPRNNMCPFQGAPRYSGAYYHPPHRHTRFFQHPLLSIAQTPKTKKKEKGNALRQHQYFPFLHSTHDSLTKIHEKWNKH